MAPSFCGHGFLRSLDPVAGKCPSCSPRPKGTPATVFVRPADRVRAEDQRDPDDLEGLA